MFDLLITLTAISLLDSLSMLPFAVVALAVLLAGPKPYLTSMMFLLGISVSNFACGLLITWGLGETIQRVTEALVYWFKNPSSLDYIFSLIVGVALMAFGYRWANARRVRNEKSRTPTVGMGPIAAFGLGVGATIAGIWGALPYFAGIDQILKSDVTMIEGVIALAYYNVIFIALAAMLIIVKAVLGARAAAVFAKVDELITVWGKRALIAGMIVLGAVMLADAIGWMLGRPVIPTR